MSQPWGEEPQVWEVAQSTGFQAGLLYPASLRWLPSDPGAPDSSIRPLIFPS